MSDNLVPDFQLPPPPKPERPTRGGETSDFLLPGVEKPDVEKDWGQAGWGEVLSSGLRNAPSSALHQITAIPEAIMNPSQTLEGVKMLGRGAMSKAGLGGSDDADQRRQDEAVFNAVIAPYTSIAGFKKSLATDPFEILTTAGMALSGGASGAAKIGKTIAGSAVPGAGAVGKTIEAGGKGLEALSYAADPTKAALKGAELGITKLAAPAVGKTIETVSGVNAPTIGQAFEAGATRDPLLKQGFNEYAKGSGSAVDLSQTMSDAFNKMRQAEIAKWAEDKSNLATLGSNVDLAPAFKAVEEFRKNIGPIEGGVGPSVRDAHKVLDKIEEQLNFRNSLPDGHPMKTVEGIDQLKRSIWSDAEQASGYSEKALKQAWKGVRESLSQSGGAGYTKLMDKYDALLDGLNNARKTLGTGNNVAANTELAKLIRQFGDEHGAKEIQRLAQQDPTIPYKIAGASLRAAAGHPTTWDRNLSLFNMGHFGAALYSGDMPWIMKATAGLAAQKLLLNPETLGKTAYYSGAVAGSPVGKAAGVAADVAGAIRPVVTPALMQLQNAVTEETGEPTEGFAVRPGTQYRPGRATGGRIMDHEAISDKLVRQAEQIKKEVSNHTEKLLNTPDDHVAKALEIANRHI